MFKFKYKFFFPFITIIIFSFSSISFAQVNNKGRGGERDDHSHGDKPDKLEKPDKPEGAEKPIKSSYFEYVKALNIKKGPIKKFKKIPKKDKISPRKK